MATITQVEPVTQLQRNYQVVFEQLDSGPVVLSRSGRAAAVLVSVEQWDRQAARLAYFERQQTADARATSNDWVAGDELDQALKAAGAG